MMRRRALKDILICVKKNVEVIGGLDGQTHNLAIDEPWKALSPTLVKSLFANILQREKRKVNT